jgi:hypothetical protein
VKQLYSPTQLSCCSRREMRRPPSRAAVLIGSLQRRRDQSLQLNEHAVTAVPIRRYKLARYPVSHLPAGPNQA